MRKNVTINNYYITQKPRNTRPQQQPKPEEPKDKVEYGWAIEMGRNPF